MPPAEVTTERESARPPRLNASEVGGVAGALGIAARCWIGVNRVGSIGSIGGTVEEGRVAEEEEGEVPAMDEH